MRALRGYFAFARPGQPVAPYLDAYVDDSDLVATGQVTFLVDTGADITTLSAIDGLRILGYQRYLALIDSGRRVTLAGVGGGSAFVERRLTLRVPTVDDDEFRFPLEMLIAAATRDDQGRLVYRDMPSLLGRDFLNFFTLTISPGHDIVSLEEDEDVAVAV